jgi:hypothetical protein
VIEAVAATRAYAQSAPFTLTLGAARYEVKVGAPVDIRVVMTNTSDHDLDWALARMYVK